MKDKVVISILRAQLDSANMTKMEVSKMNTNKAKPRGEWKEMTDNYGHSSYFCSRCGTQEGKPHDVCPNCRAEMKGGAE